ncbi:MAG: sel1 repeat family protein, partial [Roseiarcus sp.]
KAADQGNAGAQLNLGAMYDNGRGVPQDHVLAYMWANLAASRAADSETRAQRLRTAILQPPG